MGVFYYKAKKKSAEVVTGQVTAQTQDEAIEIINRLGLLPVSLEERAKTVVDSGPREFRTVRSRDVYVFTRQLANLVRSGLSLIRSLGVMEEQVPDAYFKGVIAAIGSNVKNGRSFSECLRDYPHIFSSLYVALVRAGEESGNIHEILERLAVHQQRQQELASKIRSALAYPLFMLGVGILTVIFIFTFVIPKMQTLFESLGDQLPAPTAVLLSISQVLAQPWAWGVMGVALLVLAVSLRGRAQTGEVFGQKLFVQLPLFKTVILDGELSRFARTLSLLLKSGVPIISALEITIPVLHLDFLKKDFQQCKKALVEGGSFGLNLKKCPRVPPMMGQFIAVGEESGNLDEILAEIAGNYEQETEEKIKILTTLLEPMLVLIIGLVIGLMVFAILLPVFQMDVLVQ